MFRTFFTEHPLRIDQAVLKRSESFEKLCVYFPEFSHSLFPLLP